MSDIEYSVITSDVIKSSDCIISGVKRLKCYHYVRNIVVDIMTFPENL